MNDVVLLIATQDSVMLGGDALIMWTEALRTSSYQEQLQGLREKLYVRLRQHADSPPSPRPRPSHIKVQDRKFILQAS